MKQVKKKVLVGLSGGVDSSVAAALLVEQGYEVIGAFMKNWSGKITCGGEEVECGWKDERRDAMRVAAALGIPFMTFDFEKEYREQVIETMFAEFERGRTPNPDILCNKFMKFDLFLRGAEKLGCDYVATGHYARVEHGEKNKILMGKDVNKDQTYFLWAIDPSVLGKVLFPIGDMDKSDVRAYAERMKLPVHDKKDSVGICFVGDVDIQEFLKERIPEDPGEIVTTEGKVVGKHHGVNFFTIGQRKGLGVAGGPYYVVDKDLEKKRLIVSSQYSPKLYEKELAADQTNWFCKPESLPHDCLCRVRYRQEPVECTIDKIKDDKVRIAFKKEQRAITSGQSLVLYDGEEMIGGGVIE
jgi:tRNA-uridine 2-sulfurtransferase